MEPTIKDIEEVLLLPLDHSEFFVTPNDMSFYNFLDLYINKCKFLNPEKSKEYLTENLTELFNCLLEELL